MLKGQKVWNQSWLRDRIFSGPEIPGIGIAIWKSPGCGTFLSLGILIFGSRDFFSCICAKSPGFGIFPGFFIFRNTPGIFCNVIGIFRNFYLRYIPGILCPGIGIFPGFFIFGISLGFLVPGIGIFSGFSIFGISRGFFIRIALIKTFLLVIIWVFYRIINIVNLPNK